jgi:ATP-dependent exoDNAse (exonuclease V) beta subunit
LISKDARPEDVAADRSRYDTWRLRRSEWQAAGAIPSMTVMTATQTPPFGARSPKPGARQVITIEDGSLKSLRPSGKRFGSLVHALLASVPLDADRKQIDELATLHTRLLAATDEECGAAATIVHHVLTHPRLVAARDAEAKGRRVWREAPIAMRMDGTGNAGGPTLVDGQIDLAYETDDAWVVVDFKTDVEMASAEDAYRQQVAIYVDAVARATGKAAEGVLLRV